MPPIDPYVQYGALGLLALIVGWTLFRGVPLFVAANEKAAATLVALLKEECERCKADREKDREARHALGNQFQLIIKDVLFKIDAALAEIDRQRGPNNRSGGGQRGP